MLQKKWRSVSIFHVFFVFDFWYRAITRQRDRQKDE